MVPKKRFHFSLEKLPPARQQQWDILQAIDCALLPSTNPKGMKCQNNILTTVRWSRVLRVTHFICLFPVYKSLSHDWVIQNDTSGFDRLPLSQTFSLRYEAMVQAGKLRQQQYKKHYLRIHVQVKVQVSKNETLSRHRGSIHMPLRQRVHRTKGGGQGGGGNKRNKLDILCHAEQCRRVVPDLKLTTLAVSRGVKLRHVTMS